MRKYCKASVNIAIAVVLLLLVIFLLPRMLSFFMPFVVGWIIAWIASPMVRFFEEKIKLKRKAGSAFVIIAVIGLIIFLMHLLITALVGQLDGMLNDLPAMWVGLEKDLLEIGRKFSAIYNRMPVNLKTEMVGVMDQLGNSVGEVVSGLSEPTIDAVSNFAMQLPSIIIAIIMALLSSYFFVADRGAVYDWFRKHTPASVQARFLIVKRSLVKAVGGYLKAQLKIEIWMYLLLVIGLSILQVDYVLVIALIIALLDFFPFFGTGTIMVPWAIIEILEGSYQRAIGLLIIWCVGQLARQIIQPKIVGDSVGVPTIPTLFLLYIGYKFSGVLGMLVAVPVGLIIYTMYDEGLFDTTKNSILILVAGINKFRRLEAEDMAVVKELQEVEKVQEGKQEDSHA